MLRALDRLDSVPLRGIVDARDPFFSPDGRAIGFFDRDTLRKVSITGAPPIALCRLSGRSRGASWGTDDTIVFATSDTSSGLLSVPVGGGEPKVLTKPDAQRGEQDHFFPSVLPGGRSVLFTVVSGVGAEPSYVAILDLQTGQYRKLISQGGRAEYVETGYLIYEEASTIWAVRFDLSTQQVLGDPVPVVERLAGRNFSVSRQGTLVYTPANAPGGPLVWVSREGHEDPIAAPPRAYLYPRLSPDGSRVAARITEQELHIWIWDFSRQALTRLTLEPGITTYPLWAGDHIIFTSSRSGAANPCLPATQIVPCFQRLPAQGDFTSEPNLGPSRFEYERHPPPR